MSKPTKKRACRRLISGKYYMPKGFQDQNPEEVTLRLDEFESMRLVDYEGLSQIQASEEMKISRGTVQRLLVSARFKIVEALLENKSIAINNEIKNIQLKGENKMDKRSKDVIRIAMPTTDGITVDEHFGHCKSFAVYDMEGNNIVDQKSLTPPPHAPGVLPNFLGEHEVDVIITGGMGQMAIRLFKDQNIDVILGASGKIDETLAEYVGGELVSKGTPCDHHHE
ncbi:DUF134 domain-containing protein [Clostridia bacterium]|nr:DUF134 domain-containing protein [Clostridia bacterium]